MSKNKLAIPRLMHFVAMLKENRYPNHPRLVEEMRKLDIAGAYTITQKTVQRDVNYLKNDYSAPIAYDYLRKGYYLLDPEWNFNIPSLTGAEMEAAVLGARLAETILPDPVGGVMRQSMDRIVAASATPVVDARASLLALIATGSKVPILPEIFSEIFKGWQTRHALLLTYKGAKDHAPAEYLVEPHVLVFHDGCWYLKVKLLKSDRIVFEELSVITLAVHRINRVTTTPATFETDQKIVDSMTHGQVFDFPMVHNVTLKVTGASATYGVELFGITPNTVASDGSLMLHISEVEEYRIINFVMASQGDAEIITPRALIKTVAKAAKKILEKHKTK